MFDGKKIFHVFVVTLLLSAVCSSAMAKPNFKVILRGMNAPKDSIWLDELDLSHVTTGWGAPRAKQAINGAPMVMGGAPFGHGIGAGPETAIVVKLSGEARRFLALVGINDWTTNDGSAVFEVWVDGKKTADSGLMKAGQKPKLISVDIAGAEKMILQVVAGPSASSNDNANWGGALIVMNPGVKSRPEIIETPQDPPMEIAHTDNGVIGIHGPRIAGTTPGKPFVFLVAATGKQPLSFEAANLPAGLKLDGATGVITGSLEKAGEYIVNLKVRDAAGATAQRGLRIVGGTAKLALTPPMGWNSWNVWGTSVSDEKVRDAADAMMASGLAAHGYQFVNIDDAWEKDRDANGEITTNEKFPDMKALGDYVHSLGLRLGIYSSPGPFTCARYEGSYLHEQQDADTFAEWGIDYLKYDWCGYRTIAKSHDDLDELMKPYFVMRDALLKCRRDIVYSLCQYGMGDVWEWGEKVGGNLWRTTGDITDTWVSMSSIGFRQNGHEVYAGPGHWNDPDMLVVGKVGWGPSLRDTRLSENEQITHITLWSMLASPLLIGCDMTRMDRFTVDVLTNDEVLDVNQDPAGKQGRRIKTGGGLEIWARPLWDGTQAVALFNKSVNTADVTVDWADLGLSGAQRVRDLWRKKDLGSFEKSFTAEVPVHGAVIVKVGTPERTDW